MKTKNAFSDASLHFGIIGVLAFMVWVLIFLQDWSERYPYLIYLLPLPVIFLLIARKFRLPGGLLLIVLGLGAAVFDVLFSPGHPGKIAGVGLGYTILFVALPLVISGLFSLLCWRLALLDRLTDRLYS
jgi:hypothetical protein